MIISQEQYSKCIQIRYLSLIHGTMWQNAIFLSQKFNFFKVHTDSEKFNKIGQNLQSWSDFVQNWRKYTFPLLGLDQEDFYTIFFQ